MGLVQGESRAQRFFQKWGASLLDRTICASAGSAGHQITLGSRVGMDMELADEAKLIVFWGCNAITSSVHFWARAQAAKRRGATLVAVDPYRSLTAEKCHIHVAPLPGTDGALTLGLMHVLSAMTSSITTTSPVIPWALMNCAGAPPNTTRRPWRRSAGSRPPRPSHCQTL